MQKKTAWAGCLKVMHLMLSGAAHRARWQALSQTGKRNFCRCLARDVDFRRSSLLPDDDVEYMKQKGVEVKIIPAAGHSMSWENPSALAQAVAECMSA